MSRRGEVNPDHWLPDLERGSAEVRSRDDEEPEHPKAILWVPDPEQTHGWREFAVYPEEPKKRGRRGPMGLTGQRGTKRGGRVTMTTERPAAPVTAVAAGPPPDQLDRPPPTDREIRCWFCYRLLELVRVRPWSLRCPRCKTFNNSPSSRRPYQARRRVAAQVNREEKV